MAAGSLQAQSFFPVSLLPYFLYPETYIPSLRPPPRPTHPILMFLEVWRGAVAKHRAMLGPFKKQYTNVLTEVQNSAQALTIEIEFKKKKK